MPKKFRKKPVVIEAFQFGMQERSDLPIWAKEALQSGSIKAFSQYGGTVRWAEIETLEGVHRAEVGDYIIKGVKGELYPCKPDIFHMTYEEVDNHA
ncbi:hypothetical protein [Desulforamulus ruminis]|uniref:Phage protein n=1 Tax=Desulforamulus ruminis (strain ATCC 23193 / DSM 2154 / NCIMB 8452 / DL) TaxID=696281 RepID=F6DM38_DESRL|nr:hypothetical protein [Desulforamulus ruminis]AEG59380.1 hypothetical protein Desru_1105 [Desulforamulus ruminis DSM 2154]